MAEIVVKQPNGLYAIFDSAVDDFILRDVNEDEIMAYFISEAVKEAIKSVKRKMEEVNSLNNNFTYFDALKRVCNNGGDI